MRRLMLLMPLLLFVACTSEHPLAGYWNEELADGNKGMTLGFDTKVSTCYLHGRPREDGGHAHDDGPFTFDAATGAVTVNVDLLEDGTKEWAGRLADGVLTLSAADQKLTFKLGESAH